MGIPLLKESIEKGTSPRLLVSEFRQEGEPIIGQPCWFKWRLRVEGSNEFNQVENLKVALRLPRKYPFSIHDFFPKEGQEKVGELKIGTQGFTVSVPLIKKTIQVHLTSKEEVQWEFFGVDLDRTYRQAIEGAVSIEFDEGSEYQKIPVSMHVTPVFCTRGLRLRKKYCKAPPTCDEPICVISPYDRERGRPAESGSTSELEATYTWDLNEGILRKTGNIENVSLRRETLSLLLQSFFQNVPSKQYSNILREAGKEIGRSFVDDISGKTSRKLDLDRWSEYDASAGMGKMMFHRDEKNEILQVTVKNCFEAAKRQSDQPICHFMEGYIGGILSSISGKLLDVDEVQCIAQGHETCIFRVQVSSTT